MHTPDTTAGTPPVAVLERIRTDQSPNVRCEVQRFTSLKQAVCLWQLRRILESCYWISVLLVYRISWNYASLEDQVVIHYAVRRLDGVVLASQWWEAHSCSRAARDFPFARPPAVDNFLVDHRSRSFIFILVVDDSYQCSGSRCPELWSLGPCLDPSALFPLRSQSGESLRPIQSRRRRSRYISHALFFLIF
jgi:hypothetical protein